MPPGHGNEYLGVSFVTAGLRIINTIFGAFLLLSLAACGGPPSFVTFPGIARVGTPIPISPSIVGQWQRAILIPGATKPEVETITIYPINRRYYFICDKTTGGATSDNGVYYARGFLVHSGKSLVLDINVLDPSGFSLGKNNKSSNHKPSFANKEMDILDKWKIRRYGYFLPLWGLYKITVNSKKPNWISVLPFDRKNPKWLGRGWNAAKNNSKLILSKLGINEHSTPQEIQAGLRRMSKRIYELNPGGFGVHHAPMVFNRVKNPIQQ